MWFPYLIYFLDQIEDHREDFNDFFRKNLPSMYYKGYGTPEMEIKFMHKVFLHIHSQHPTFRSFSWSQSSAYNDNYHHFQLQDFIVNDFYSVDCHNLDFYFAHDEYEEYEFGAEISHIQFPDPEFMQNNNIEFKDGYFGNENDLEKYDDYNEKKHRHLQVPCQKFSAFLKLLEVRYSMYYFLYAFGAEVNIRFDKEGVTVKKIHLDEIEQGSPLWIDFK